MSGQSVASIEVLAPSDGPPFARRREPLALGVPLRRGMCRDLDGLRLIDPAGGLRPLQTSILSRWSDGSVRWLLLDFQADHDGGGSPAVYQLVIDDSRSAEADAHQLTVRESGGTVSVDTGTARFSIRAAGSWPVAEVHVDGAAIIDAARTTCRIEDERGQLHPIRVETIEVEERGPLRAAVRVEGQAVAAGGEPFIRVAARLHFFAGSTAVRSEISLHNPRRAQHPGGIWELGDEGSVYLRDASIVFGLPAADGPVEVRCSLEPGAAAAVYDQPFELLQESSGGGNWNSRTHVDRTGAVPLRFNGYRLRAGAAESFGTRATPVVAVSRAARRLIAAVPDFWQNFPRAVEANRESLVVGLFPRQAAVAQELQGGERKTHLFYVAFGSDRVSDQPLAWACAPLTARLTPEQYCASGAVPYLTPSASDPHPAYLRLVNAALDGGDTFASKREQIDEYGWRSFGDLYADHENVYAAGPHPIISHYNNQYDPVGGFALQFMRSGDLRWHRHMAELAAHVTDIDIYQTDDDRAVYNHGLFWHSAHYFDAGKSSHRTYPRAEGVSGGGPANEHNYTSGLLLHYFLTGDRRSRDAVIALGRWVIAMDDGAATRFRFLSRAATGAASSTNSPDYHGPGRGAGYSINALLDASTLTGDPTFLTKAEALIRRCIHPADDIAGRDLLNAERRWSYTVFLCALGKYLDFKAERQQLDAAYAYARSALLAYARWMAAHEQPYFERKEQLEFPTETWIAQEMWKSDAFNFARQHAAGGERARFRERAEFFFRYSTETLLTMPTHTMTRPMVLMLSHGYMHAYFALHPDMAKPPADVIPAHFPAPERFVPQKERAKRRAIVCLAAGGAVAASGLIALLARLL